MDLGLNSISAMRWTIVELSRRSVCLLAAVAKALVLAAWTAALARPLLVRLERLLEGRGSCGGDSVVATVSVFASAGGRGCVGSGLGRARAGADHRAGVFYQECAGGDCGRNGRGSATASAKEFGGGVLTAGAIQNPGLSVLSNLARAFQGTGGLPDLFLGDRLCF